jgi:5-(carboxyamino)imidazole ribonucleotide synthase
MRVGVLGGGQLGRMLALAGHPLGLHLTFLDPSPDAPMSTVAQGLTAPFDDAAALAELAARSDVVTWEFENVPLASVDRLARTHPVYPRPAALAAKKDRLTERKFFESLGIATAPYATAESLEGLTAALAAIGYPAVVKTRSQGYDGKGQAVLRDGRHVSRVWEALHGVPLLVEKFIPFDREVSIVAVRGRGGETAFYPIGENHHAGGILRHTIAPAPDGESLQGLAEEAARRVLDKLDYAGVLAIEFFVTGGRLLANEMAPRVHNSGHWTIDGALTSQFENHLRAVCGFPLGSTAARGQCAMVNILGSYPELDKVLAIPGARLHHYGKAPRPGRKLGHVNLCDPAGGGEAWRAFEHRLGLLTSLVEVHEEPRGPGGSQLGLPF